MLTSSLMESQVTMKSHIKKKSPRRAKKMNNGNQPSCT